MTTVEIEPTSEPATKGQLALVRAELLAEIRNLRTWAAGRFAAMEARFEAGLEALRLEMLGRIERCEKRMWRAMTLQFGAFLAGVAAIERWL